MMTKRRSLAFGAAAALAVLAAAATRLIAPAPVDAARLDVLARRALAADSPLDFSVFARKLCFFADAGLLSAEAERFGAPRLDGEAPEAGPAILAFVEQNVARLIAPDPRRLDWDRSEGGGAFCAASARVSPTTSGGLYLADFQGVFSSLAP